MARTFTCPKCEADISDSYQQDEPDVGIVGGWFCETCNEGFEDKDEVFEDDVFIHSSPKDYSGPQYLRCPAHPDILPEMGFGLAGGGYGPYSYCPACGAILAKSQEH